MYPREDGSGLELRDYVRALSRHPVFLVVTPLVAVVFALVLTQLQTPMYAATAELLFQSAPGENLFDTNTGQFVDPDRRLRNEIRLLRSAPVRDAVHGKLGTAPAISAMAEADTDVIRLRAESPDAETAAAIVNAYATAYIDNRQERALDDLFAAAQKVQEKLSQLQVQIDAAPVGQKEELIKVQGVLRQELERLQLNADLQTAGAQVVTPATAPAEPFSPRPLRNAATALVFGVVLGICLAFAREYMDDTVKDKDDLMMAAHGLPVLGLIPVAGTWKAKGPPETISLTKPTSVSAEAYRGLRTAVQFMSLDRPVRSIQVTSANAREGKTTTLANLAVALARAGQRVVVVCCDLRRPRVHEFLGVTNSFGLTSVLLGDRTLPAAMQQVQGMDRVFVLASGPLPPNPSELLSSARLAELLASLEGEGQVVLVDSSPVLPVTDALVLSRHVDASLVVAAARSTRRKDFTRAIELLRQVNAPLAGAVLNGVPPEDVYGYGQYYRQDYPVSSSVNGNGSKSSNSARNARRRRRSRARS